MNENTCCFSGHRKLPANKINKILIHLNDEIENLINKGVTNFISGGALGFDQIAASLIVAKKEMGHNIRLIFVLPYKNQDEQWVDKAKELYRNLLKEADEVIYISDEYTEDCMKKRNYKMVDRSAYCICALLKFRSGTEQTVKYVRKKGLQVINVAKSNH